MKLYKTTTITSIQRSKWAQPLQRRMRHHEPLLLRLPLHALSPPGSSHLVRTCAHASSSSRVRVCVCVYAQCCSTMTCCVACLHKCFRRLPVHVCTQCRVTRCCHACAARRLVCVNDDMSCACRVLACLSKLEDNVSSGVCQQRHMPVLCVRIVWCVNDDTLRACPVSVRWAGNQGRHGQAKKDGHTTISLPVNVCEQGVLSFAWHLVT